jgi:hypothetical protein
MAVIACWRNSVIAGIETNAAGRWYHNRARFVQYLRIALCAGLPFAVFHSS